MKKDRRTLLLCRYLVPWLPSVCCTMIYPYNVVVMALAVVTVELHRYIYAIYVKQLYCFWWSLKSLCHVVFVWHGYAKSTWNECDWYTPWLKWRLTSCGWKPWPRNLHAESSWINEWMQGWTELAPAMSLAPGRCTATNCSWDYVSRGTGEIGWSDTGLWVEQLCSRDRVFQNE